MRTLVIGFELTPATVVQESLTEHRAKGCGAIDGTDSRTSDGHCGETRRDPPYDLCSDVRGGVKICGDNRQMQDESLINLVAWDHAGNGTRASLTMD